jgi:hypothetical protein
MDFILPISRSAIISNSNMDLCRLAVAIYLECRTSIKELQSSIVIRPYLARNVQRACTRPKSIFIPCT